MAQHEIRTIKDTLDHNHSCFDPPLTRPPAHSLTVDAEDPQGSLVICDVWVPSQDVGHGSQNMTYSTTINPEVRAPRVPCCITALQAIPTEDHTQLTHLLLCPVVVMALNEIEDT